MTTLAEALAPRSDQLNADDLIAGPRILKITGARIVRDGRDTKIVINYDGDNGKPWKPCKTMGRAMVMAWSITDETQLVGKSVRVYRDPTVKFGDQGEVGGIRISHMSHIDKPVNVKLTVSQGKKGLFTLNPLVTEVKNPPVEQPTIEDAEQSLRSAPDLETLRAVWSNKAMKPFREHLQPVLEERKAALTPASSDEDDLIRLYQNAQTLADIAEANKGAAAMGISSPDVDASRAEAEARLS